ncbi:MAG: ferric reductase-like transmembrane domain-containing protein [Dehalococcoidia bacterium]
MILVRTLSYLMLLAAGVIAADYLHELFQAVPTDAPLQWWMSRATGFVAYIAMWLSMMLGLMISSRGLDGALNRKTVLESHQQWTLAAVLATLFHVAVIVSDPYVDMSWASAVVPGTSSYLPGPVALGALGMWGMVLLAVSSWFQRQISYVLWRAIHTLALGAFILGLLHGVVAGTDSGAQVAQLTYAGTAALLAGAIVFRAVYTPSKGKAARPAPAAAAVEPS